MSIRCDLSLCVNTCLVFDSFIDDGNIFHYFGPVWIILLLAKAACDDVYIALCSGYVYLCYFGIW